MYGLCISSLSLDKEHTISPIYFYPSEKDCLNKYREFLYSYLRDHHPYKDFETVNNRFSLKNL